METTKSSPFFKSLLLQQERGGFPHILQVCIPMSVSIRKGKVQYSINTPISPVMHQFNIDRREFFKYNQTLKVLLTNL